MVFDLTQGRLVAFMYGLTFVLLAQKLILFYTFSVSYEKGVVTFQGPYSLFCVEMHPCHRFEVQVCCREKQDKY